MLQPNKMSCNLQNKLASSERFKLGTNNTILLAAIQMCLIFLSRTVSGEIKLEFGAFSWLQLV